jgi:ABC-2 type transport system permease protein
MQFLAFSSYPIFLVTGYSWPRFVAPLPIQIYANLLPTTPALEALQLVALKGSNLFTIRYQLLHIIVLIFFYYSLTFFKIKSIKKG